MGFQPPVEVLIQILANLSVKEINKCMSVCKRWNSVLRDDASWRFALARWMRGKALLTRLDSRSYRREYTARYSMATSLKRPTQAFSCALEAPGTTPIFLYANQAFLLCAEKGFVWVFHTDTGKMNKKRISLNHGGIEAPISCYSMSQHDSIISGYPDGRVAVMALNSRNYLNSDITFFHDRHPNAVTAVTMWKSVILSGSYGEIRIWNNGELMSTIDIGPYTPRQICFRKKQIIVGTNESSIVTIKDVSCTAVEMCFSPSDPSPFITLLTHEYIERPVLVSSSSVLVGSTTIPSDVPISCASWVRGVNGMILVLGRTDGSIIFYRISHSSHEFLYEIPRAHSAAVMSIHVDTFRVTSKSSGWVRVWDLSVGGMLQVFRERNGRPNEGLLCDSDVLLSTSNRFIRSWSFGAVISTREKARAGNVPSPVKVRARRERDMQRGLADQMRIGFDVLDKEREDLALRTRFVQKYSPGDLTEDEMLRYAMVLSAGDDIGGIASAVEPPSDKSKAAMGECDLELALRLSLQEN
ncbi:MAG: hypothetical protein SGCHY_001352 [Lobulomycetales sp.]